MQPFSNTNNRKKVILEAIGDLAQNFKNKSSDKSELAYLALTSKIENPLRDRIAFNIYNKIGDNYLVCREWRGNFKEEGKRHATDIAILEKGKDKKKPIVLIEFKAQSVPGYTKEYSGHMKHDLNYLKIKADDETDLYYVQFTNVFENQYTNLSNNKKVLEDDIFQSVKYFEKINSRIKKFLNENLDLGFVINDTWKKHLKALENHNGGNTIENKFIKEIKIPGGEYHGHKISVIAQVLGPLYIDDLINLDN